MKEKNNSVNTKKQAEKELKIDYTNKPLTSYGGLAILQKFFCCINLKEFLNDLFPFVEKSNRRIAIYDKFYRYCADRRREIFTYDVFR